MKTRFATLLPGWLLSLGITCCAASVFTPGAGAYPAVLGFSLCFSVLFLTPAAKFLPGALLALLTGLLWSREKPALIQLAGIALSRFGLFLPYTQTGPDSVTLIWCLLCGWNQVLVCRHRPGFFRLLPALAVLIICLSVPGTPPHTGALFVTVLAGLILLLGKQLPQSAAARHLPRLLLPAAVLVGLLFSLVPRETGGGGWQIPLPGELFSFFSQYVPLQPGLDLTQFGPLPEEEQVLMEVTTSTGGPLYLRGKTYNRYTGTAWAAEFSSDPLFLPQPELPSGQTVTLQSSAVFDVLYHPYYPETLSWQNGYVPNRENLTQYTLSCSPSPGYAAPPGTEDTHLPETAKTRAQTLLARISMDEETNVPQAIQDYVGNRCRYARATAAMPPGETDFSLWFLEAGDTGYCIHFASAAAVLLRAAGIPARLVTGYLVNTEPGIATPVTTSNAHAWVEYYLPESGWLLLEATPAPAVTATPEPSAPQPDSPLWLIWLLPLLLLPAGVCCLLPRKSRPTPEQALFRLWQKLALAWQALDRTPPEELHLQVLRAAYGTGELPGLPERLQKALRTARRARRRRFLRRFRPNRR